MSPKGSEIELTRILKYSSDNQHRIETLCQEVWSGGGCEGVADAATFITSLQVMMQTQNGDVTTKGRSAPQSCLWFLCSLLTSP